MARLRGDPLPDEHPVPWGTVAIHNCSFFRLHHLRPCFGVGQVAESCHQRCRICAHQFIAGRERRPDGPSTIGTWIALPGPHALRVD